MSHFPSTQLLTVAAFAIVPAFAMAQRPSVSFFHPDPHFPIEITADHLAVKKSDNTVLFEGNVLLLQRDLDLRLHCSRALVWYDADSPSDHRDAIRRLDCEL
jgi:lipopolysaccharide export system protein LptA